MFILKCELCITKVLYGLNSNNCTFVKKWIFKTITAKLFYKLNIFHENNFIYAKNIKLILFHNIHVKTGFIFCFIFKRNVKTSS